ncbi:MAG TPA: nucleotide exchange factor GrpE [Tenuifilaceae bacterium]|nr:nucleotide exchange factor GrpE [Tenuifilaceae bacterium]HPE17797.1 nucleotide exchange factor GrpE [Tenuifilaceae bacterium]HPJ45306.1 nucleotide exchange factor GrpE [Tenuifilaceae bacterium]HPQ33653.1 nucleotide exchange factor GrpE [Tenuifilaceae bacterium]HRX67281.1 nucleotide exchange factor GrpE [Tenuifilaceae bacterium]
MKKASTQEKNKEENEPNTKKANHIKNGDVVNNNEAKNSEQTTEHEVETKAAGQEVEPNIKDDLECQLNEFKDKYLRLSAEFDNYRKRTQREKMDLIKFGSEDVLKALLPVIDDFERAMKSLDSSTDINAVKQGLHLIHSKFTDFLKNNGVQEIPAVGMELDTDVHEAITKTPAPEETLKGKIIDVVEKGYKLNEKVIRFSKVVVGE